MNRERNWSIWLIDGAGLTVVVAIVTSAVWLFAIRGEQTRGQIRTLVRVTAAARGDLEVLRQERGARARLLSHRQRELSTQGRLPTGTSVESYFQELSALALQNGLRVVRHNPLMARSYPGLLEQRFAYEVVGTLSDLGQFFKAIERSDFWADVSYLRIGDGHGKRRSKQAATRTALLTISIFSATSESEQPEHEST